MAGTGCGPALRVARPEDVVPIADLVQAAYRDGGGRAWTTEADLVEGRRTSAAEVQALLERPDSALLVAEPAGAGDRLVGCCSVRGGGAEADFGLFAVDPACQGEGIGAALLRAAEELAARRFGAGRMRLQVISVRAELIAWYERRGYRDTGRRVLFPTDNPEDRPRVAGLAFAVFEKDLDPPLR